MPLNNNILLISLFYPPDIAPGAFRMEGIIKIFKKKKEKNVSLITAYPFRYPDYKISFEELKDFQIISGKSYDIHKVDNITIYRIKLRKHNKTLSSQVFSYIKFFYFAIKISFLVKPSVVFATSGRMMTSFLGYIVSIIHRSKLIVEFRDIFSIGIKSHNFFKFKILNYFFYNIFYYIENLMIKRSTFVNFVSNNFKIYYSSNYNHKIRIYPNGIDSTFMNKIFSKKKNTKAKILYVGNIGEAQNLHNFIVDFSLKLKNKANITIIGNGNAKNFLLEEINKKESKNINLINPVPKEQLINYYHECDILILNLSNKEMFRSVIPSKIYEYITIDKPILIGCDGETLLFKKYTDNLYFFNPSDSNSAYKAFNSINFSNKNNNLISFKKKYSRETISNNIVKDIYHCMDNIL